MLSTSVGEARRSASDLAARLGFDETRQGTVALVVSEAASNLVKHTGGGELIVQGRGWDEGDPWVEVLALDRGPGMTDIGRCLADGYSTAGSLGNGLGAIARLADAYEIDSHRGQGTAIWARLDANPRSKVRSDCRFDLGAVSLPAPGEVECGDDWTLIRKAGRTFLMVVDGLGHGPFAAQAAAAAVRSIREYPAEEPIELIEAAHRHLAGTRGAAMSIVRIDPALGRVRFAGVGNISAVILDGRTGRTTTMISQNGTVGHVIHKIQAFDYPWTQDSLMILHSDGLTTRGTWRVTQGYP